jgi:transcriptional regulator with XRE-family HTH domain
MELRDFGVKLARIRIAKNLSAYALSLMLGKSANYIHRVEYGKVNISLRAILEICECLEIEPRILFEN